MPSLRDIRRRIRSVDKTQQITRAMRMVSAAKLRRAQDAILAARPYAERMRATLGEVARGRPDAEHPLLERRDSPRRLELVVVTSDRGLCGAYNSNVLRLAQSHLEAREGELEEVALTLVGEKAVEFFRRRRPQQVAKAYHGLGTIQYGHAGDIAHRLQQRYVSGEADVVELVYNEFVSALSQQPRLEPLLPVVPPEAGEEAPHEIEPSPQELLNVLVPRAIEVSVFRALLENQAGEHAARMNAMEAATRNSEEMIDDLTLQYNRARQAAITKELVEIITGAEAL